MSLLSKRFTIGNLNIGLYDFESIGDKLGSHIHEEDTSHITIVARGKVKVSGEGWSNIWNVGTLADTKPHVAHEFEALENNTRIINIVKVQI